MELKEGQRLRVKEFDERPKHWNWEGGMDKWMDKIVTFKEYDDEDIRIYEDYRWFWKKSDFQIIFDTWKDVSKLIEEECDKHIGCSDCPINNEYYCYGDLLKMKIIKN